MDYMKNFEVNGTCGLHGKKYKNTYRLEDHKGRENLRGLGINGRIFYRE